jgi:hypothetical protein
MFMMFMTRAICTILRTNFQPQLSPLSLSWWKTSKI